VSASWRWAFQLSIEGAIIPPVYGLSSSVCGEKEMMIMKQARYGFAILVGILLSTVVGFAAEPVEIETFVKARIEIGEMMMNYFQGGGQFAEGQRPSPEQMKEMGADINAKLSTLLAKHNLTVADYRKRSPEIFADDAAVKGFLNGHPDLKKRYEALPLDRMGRGGSTGRGY
jgi:hypothetical protein